ncbi:MAG: hypothetical protein ACREQR_08365 [Candidatus Binataceae bacterium]
MGNDTDRLEAQLVQAKEQLHQTLAEVNERAEEIGDQLQPDRIIERYSMAAVVTAAAAGLLLGTIDDNFLVLRLMTAAGGFLLAGRFGKDHEKPEIEHAGR